MPFVLAFKKHPKPSCTDGAFSNQSSVYASTLAVCSSWTCQLQSHSIQIEPLRPDRKWNHPGLCSWIMILHAAKPLAIKLHHEPQHKGTRIGQSVTKDTVQMLRVEKPAKSLIKSPSMFQKLHMSHHFPSLSSSFPALQVHPPWVRCLESNPKMLSKGWSRYGYMALQGDWLAISNQDAHRIRRQTGNTPSMLAYCARRVHNLKSWKRMDNLEWLVPPNHHMKVPLVWLDPCKS